MLKIQYVSDVHGQFKLIKRDPSADVLVVAGDWCDGMPNISSLLEWPIPVVYVLGNHESYHNDTDDIIIKLKQKTAGTNIRVLEKDVWIYRGVRFIGCTGWTDMCNTDPWIITQAAGAMSDYKFIKSEKWLKDPLHNAMFHNAFRNLPIHTYQPGNLHPLIVSAKHVQARQFLERALAEPFDGATVVVTHHPPSPRALRHSGKWLPEPHPDMNFALLHDAFPKAGWHRLGTYASRLDDIITMHQPTAWIHGHIHQRMEYFVHNTPVLMNAIGHQSSTRLAPAVFHTNSLAWWKKREVLINLTSKHHQWIQTWVLPAIKRDDISVDLWTPHAYRLHLDALYEAISLGANISIPQSLSFDTEAFWLDEFEKISQRLILPKHYS